MPKPMQAMCLLNEMDLDKTNFATFFNSVVPGGGETTTPVAELLAAARAGAKYQQNPLRNIAVGHNTMYVFTSPPQSAKTGVSMGLVTQTGIMLDRMPAIIFTQNKREELERFDRNTETFTEIYHKCASAVACPDAPRLKAICADSHDFIGKFDRALQKFRENGKEIPVMLALQNKSNAAKAKKVMLKILQRLGSVDDGSADDGTSRELKKRIKVLILFDEGDLATKGGLPQWDQQLRKVFEAAIFGEKTFLDVASSVAYVTATPHALLASDLPVDQRKLVFSEIPVSSNYCGYPEGAVEPINFTPIIRKVATRQEYYDYVTTSALPIAGMIYTSLEAEASVSARTQEACDTAVRYKAVRRFVTCSWSSKKLDVYTSSADIQQAMDSTEGFTRNVCEEDSDVIHYKGDDIRDYPTFITRLTEELGEQANGIFFKSILFGCEMVTRGVPVCGVNHERHLDSMFVCMPDSSDELVTQVCGRLCAVVPAIVRAGMNMTLFAPEKTHEKHISALSTTRFCCEALEKMGAGGNSIRDELELLSTQVEDGKNGGVVTDRFGVMDFLKNNITRPGPLREGRKRVAETEKDMRQKKMKFEVIDSDDSDEEQPAPAAAPAAAPEAEPAAAPEAGPAAAPEAGPETGPAAAAAPAPAPAPEPVDGDSLAEEDPGMDVLMLNHLPVLIKLMKKLTRGVPVNYKTMAKKIVKKKKYPSTDGSTMPLAVVKHVATNHVTELEEAGVTVSGGWFLAVEE